MFIEKCLSDIASNINKTLNEFNSELSFTGPSPRKTENNQNISYNIYSRNEFINNIWLKLLQLIQSEFQKLSEQGEVIVYDTTQGTISDQGTEYFQVLKANIFECYIYEPESFLYARLLEEYDPIKKNKWISIDIDGIERSAWFVE